MNAHNPHERKAMRKEIAKADGLAEKNARIADVAGKFARGEISLREISNEFPNGGAAEARRKGLEIKLGTSLEYIGGKPMDPDTLIGNGENRIGFIRVPVGIAGPVKIKGQHANGEYFIPMATTEGGLIASTSRGCSAINKAGGASAIITYDGMTRAPLFKVNIGDGPKFAQWVEDNFKGIKAAAETTTTHGKLRSIKPFYHEKHPEYIWLRFEYDTGDASGLNMVTIATQAAVDWMREKQKLAKMLALSGNVCVDKKASLLNLELGRGKGVTVQVVIPKEIVKAVLKCEPKDFVEVNFGKNHLGSEVAGAIGKNAHHANMVAAAFIALGQDPAHVVDGSTGTTNAHVTKEGDLWVEVNIMLTVGTVGGGTRVETQREALNLMNVKSAKELAEVIAVTVLAGEISLLGALTAEQLASAHDKLGRSKDKEKK